MNQRLSVIDWLTLIWLVLESMATDGKYERPWKEKT